MKKNKLFESLLLFGSLAFLVMWVDQFFYKSVEIKDSYFFLMFALAGFLFYTYRRGVRLQSEKAETKDSEQPQAKKKSIFKATASSPKNKKKRK